MNPTSDERGPLQLPTPMSAESLPGAGMPAIALPVPGAPLPAAPINMAGSSADSTTPAVADDVDLIEKEWVHKAKAIISQTQNDPHQQSKELSIFKADYMQKRYNKVLKLSE